MTQAGMSANGQVPPRPHTRRQPALHAPYVSCVSYSSSSRYWPTREESPCPRFSARGEYKLCVSRGRARAWNLQPFKSLWGRAWRWPVRTRTKKKQVSSRDSCVHRAGPWRSWDSSSFVAVPLSAPSRPLCRTPVHSGDHSCATVCKWDAQCSRRVFRRHLAAGHHLGTWASWPRSFPTYWTCWPVECEQVPFATFLVSASARLRARGVATAYTHMYVLCAG